MATNLTRKDLRAMYRDGDTYLSILTAAVQSGVEFPDAIGMMVWEFNLDDEEVQELKDDYDNCA